MTSASIDTIRSDRGGGSYGGRGRRYDDRSGGDDYRGPPQRDGRMSYGRDDRLASLASCIYAQF